MWRHSYPKSNIKSPFVLSTLLLVSHLFLNKRNHDIWLAQCALHNCSIVVTTSSWIIDVFDWRRRFSFQSIESWTLFLPFCLVHQNRKQRYICNMVDSSHFPVWSPSLLQQRSLHCGTGRNGSHIDDDDDEWYQSQSIGYYRVDDGNERRGWEKSKYYQ